jgi:hypothetical protein
VYCYCHARRANKIHGKGSLSGPRLCRADGCRKILAHNRKTLSFPLFWLELAFQNPFDFIVLFTLAIRHAYNRLRPGQWFALQGGRYVDAKSEVLVN